MLLFVKHLILSVMSVGDVTMYRETQVSNFSSTRSGSLSEGEFIEHNTVLETMNVNLPNNNPDDLTNSSITITPTKSIIVSMLKVMLQHPHQSKQQVMNYPES